MDTIKVDIDKCEFSESYEYDSESNTISPTVGFWRFFQKQPQNEPILSSQFIISKEINNNVYKFVSSIYRLSIEALKIHIEFNGVMIHYNPANPNEYYITN
jgi:hypothetical protein